MHVVQKICKIAAHPATAVDTALKDSMKLKRGANLLLI
jgi:hypothetical protein